MDQFILISVTLAFFFGGVVKGVVGVGLPLTSIALMTLVIDLRLAVPLLVIPIVVTNIIQALRGGRFKEILQRYWPMLITATIGVWAGAALLFRVDLSYLLCVLGIVISAYSLINLYTIRLTVPKKFQSALSPLVGLCSGLLAGTTGSIGVPVIIYYQALGMLKDVFVQAVGINFLFTGTIMGIAFALENGLNSETLPMSALAVIPAYLGMASGQWIRDKVSEEKFRTCLWILLLLIGFNLIRKGIF